MNKIDHMSATKNLGAQKYIAIPRLLVSPAVTICGWELTPDLDPTPVGVTWFEVVLKYKESHILHFQAIIQVDLT